MSGHRPRTASFYLQVADAPSPEASSHIHSLVRRLLSSRPGGLIDAIPGYTNILIEFDVRLTSEAKLRRLLRAAADHGQPSGRTVRIPVRYDGEDLESAAAALQLTPSELIERHSSSEYLVHALGFTPGFPFLGLLPPELRLPRRDRPRLAVPANSVAIADQQTGIYPLESPGGWHLLGTALLPVYRPAEPQPFLLEPGDRVRFVPANGASPAAPQPVELLPGEPERPFLRVAEPGLLDLVVDGGRVLAGRYGLTRSGPFDVQSAVIANRLLGNPPFAPLLEINLLGPTLEVLKEGVIAFAGWGVLPLLGAQQLEPFSSYRVKAGDVLRFRPQPNGARAYLAVAGGFEVLRHLGSTSPDLQGLIGRPLRTGDVLGAVSDRRILAGRSFRMYRNQELQGRIRLLPGPQYNPDAAAALEDGTFSIAASNRMGIQLDGPALPGGQIVSEGNPLGAVQVTPGGRAIILMNDRGTMGGYAKPALIHPADLSRAAQLREHEPVRFVFTGV